MYLSQVSERSRAAGYYVDASMTPQQIKQRNLARQRSSAIETLRTDSFAIRFCLPPRMSTFTESSVYSLPHVYGNTCPEAESSLMLRLQGPAEKPRTELEPAHPESLRKGSLTVTPVLRHSVVSRTSNTSFGAQVDGVDWSQPVPEEVVAQVRDRLLPYQNY